MKFIFLCMFILFAALTCAQETFFEFIPGWKSGYASEESDSVKVIGSGAFSLFENYLSINGISPEGEVLSTDSLAVDSCYSIDFFIASSFLSFEEERKFSARLFDCPSDDFIGVVVQLNDAGDSIVTITEYSDQILLEDIRALEISEDDQSIILSFNLDTTIMEAFTRMVYFDMDGAIQAHQDYYCPIDFACHLVPWHILPTPDGGFLFTTIEAKLGSSPHDNAYLIKTDSLGNMEWDTYVGDYDNYWIIPTWPVLADNGDILIVYSDYYEKIVPTEQPNDNNRFWIARYTIEGELILDEPILGFSFGDEEHFYIPRGMKKDEEGNLLIWGLYNRKGLLAKISQDGELLWYNDYLHPLAEENQGGEALMTTEVIGMNFASDGGYLLTGEFTSLFSGPVWPNGYQSAFLIKTDSMGCVEPGCHLVDDITEYPEALEGYGLLSVHPNPTKGLLRVEFPLLGGRAARWQLTDALGRVIPDLSIQPQGTGQVTLDLSTIQKGIYLLQLITEQGAWQARVVKE